MNPNVHLLQTNLKAYEELEPKIELSLRLTTVIRLLDACLEDDETGQEFKNARASMFDDINNQLLNSRIDTSRGGRR